MFVSIFFFTKIWNFIDHFYYLQPVPLTFLRLILLGVSGLSVFVLPDQKKEKKNICNLLTTFKRTFNFCNIFKESKFIVFRKAQWTRSSLRFPGAPDLWFSKEQELQTPVWSSTNGNWACQHLWWTAESKPYPKGAAATWLHWLTLVRQAQYFPIFHCSREDKIQIMWNPMILKCYLPLRKIKRQCYYGF